MKTRTLTLLLAFAAVLAGCQSVPPTNVHQPMTARPAPRPDNVSSNGAIFKAALRERCSRIGVRATSAIR